MGRGFGRFSVKGSTGVPQLNITSLMDMMTIILIFLLFSFSSQDQNIRLDEDVQLPRSNSEKPFKWAINVTLALDRLKVEDEFVCGLKDGRFLAAADDRDRIGPLYERLVRLKQIEGYRHVDRDSAEPVVIFHADRRHRFETLYKVMKTAAMAGYPNFRFAVIKD